MDNFVWGTLDLLQAQIAVGSMAVWCGAAKSLGLWS